jgi:hypothetical protein
MIFVAKIMAGQVFNAVLLGRMYEKMGEIHAEPTAHFHAQ